MERGTILAHTSMKKRLPKKQAKRVPAARPERARAKRQPKRVMKEGRNSDVAINPKWAWHYKVLTSLRERLLQESTDTLADATAPIEAHSSHPADSATDEFEHDIALAQLDREQHVLTDVTDAIERIRKGTYGTCLETNAPIPAQRLRAIPWCRYTQAVEQRIEAAGAAGKRRVPGVKSVRGPGSTIPGTGDIPREGAESEPKQDEEPNPGPSTEEVLQDSSRTDTPFEEE